MFRQDTEKRQWSTIFHLSIECVFAVLPLFVLGVVWPEQGESHPDSFIAGPEWSMTACVLYGLALARFLLGASAPSRTAGENRALGFATLSLLPLIGVIASVLLITKLAKGSHSGFLIVLQMVNLVLSFILFFVMGGYGISRSTKH